jgi:hypothetical protein
MELRDTRRDDPARFLRELRELRSHAGLGHADLAARAHYPCEAIKAAEAGPSLPGLPVLSAYVRGCGGTVAEWEERWRTVTGSPATPLLTARGTGWTEAADAGARVSAAPFADDEQDPDSVMAALNRVADGMAAAASASSPPSAPVADVWTPAAPAARATASTDVWTPAAPAARATANTDVWTPAAPAARAAAKADVRTPDTPGTVDAAMTSEAASGTGMAAATVAAQTMPGTRTAATSQPAPPRPLVSRKAMAVYAAVALLLVATLLAIFS